MSLPNTVIYFTAYEQIKCSMGYKVNTLNPFIPGISGGIARVLAVVVTSPLELIRTKKMSEQLTYNDLLKTLKESIQSKGLRSLWRGFIPTLWRDLPFSSKSIWINFLLLFSYLSLILQYFFVDCYHPIQQQILIQNDS